MLVTSTPPMPAAARVSSSAVRFALSTALPIHHQRVHGLASEVVAGHAKFADCATATWARRSNGKIARIIAEVWEGVEDGGGCEGYHLQNLHQPSRTSTLLLCVQHPKRRAREP